MAWVVRKGITVDHDRVSYAAGSAVPCSDAQAAAMPHAVEWVAEKAAMKAEIPAAAETATKKRK